MKGLSTLGKHIFLYIAISIIGFIIVSTVCYKIDYKRIYNYYSDRLYLQANEIANEYALDYFSETRLRSIELELHSVSVLNDTRIIFITPSGDVILILTTALKIKAIMMKKYYILLKILTMETFTENTIYSGIFIIC